MASIKLLDKQVAELIAAGEVIDRPASVVKELLENAIDAGATMITVEIKAGGIKYIRITDNGCGISHEDVPKAFLRHATSKLSTQEDLEKIQTLGFRGEALASVAAMCRVELLTKTPGALAGSRYVIEGNAQREYSEAGCPEGTTMIVRDIFYNTPARMKFLKKDMTEGNLIAAVLDRVALSHPEISFKLIRDGQIKLQTPGDGDVYSAILAVFGKDFAVGLIPVSYESAYYRITGYTCKPETAKQNRSMQTFFLNGRFIRSKTCTVALDEAYKHSIMVGKFPYCVLNVQMPSAAVDVNVHPAKTEVRFSDERAIFDLVYYGCKAALANLGQAVSAVDAQPHKRETVNAYTATNKPFGGTQQRMTSAQYRESYAAPQPLEKETHRVSPYTSLSPLPRQADTSQVRDEGIVYASKTGLSVVDQMAQKEAAAAVTNIPASVPTAVPAAPDATADAPAQPQYDRFIGELFSTYILLELDGAFLLVDKHAAHERILYEQIATQNHLADRQMVLTPIRVTLSKELYSAAVENLEAFLEIGIMAEDFGEGTLLIREIPVMLEVGDMADIVMETAAKLQKGSHDLTPSLLDDLYHSIACKAAIKGGQKNDPAEMEELVQLLRNNPLLRNCPHGRPIAIEYKKRDIEKMFGRV